MWFCLALQIKHQDPSIKYVSTGCPETLTLEYSNYFVIYFSSIVYEIQLAIFSISAYQFTSYSLFDKSNKNLYSAQTFRILDSFSTGISPKRSGTILLNFTSKLILNHALALYLNFKRKNFKFIIRYLTGFYA